MPLFSLHASSDWRMQSRKLSSRFEKSVWVAVWIVRTAAAWEKKKKKTKKSALAFLKNTKKKSFIFAILTSYSSLKFVLKKQTYYEFRWTGRRISFPCEGLKLNWASYDAWGPQVLYFSHAGCKQHFFYL